VPLSLYFFLEKVRIDIDPRWMKWRQMGHSARGSLFCCLLGNSSSWSQQIWCFGTKDFIVHLLQVVGSQRWSTVRGIVWGWSVQKCLCRSMYL